MCRVEGTHEHATSHRWEASSGNPGLGDLYLSVMDAVDAIDDRAIYFIEGAGQQSFVTAWGDGFVTDAAIISQNGLSDPRPFFDALLKKAYVGRVQALVIKISAPGVPELFSVIYMECLHQQTCRCPLPATQGLLIRQRCLV